MDDLFNDDVPKIYYDSFRACGAWGCAKYSSCIVTSMMGKIEQCASMFSKMNLANIDIGCAINGSTAAAWDDTRSTFFIISLIIIVTSSGVSSI